MLRKFLYVVILTVTTIGCGRKTIVNKPADELYCDLKKLEATILFEGKNLIRLKTIEDTFEGKPLIFLGLSYAFYNKKQDTLYLSFPEINSEKFKKIKTKYYWYDTTNAIQGFVLFKSAEELADSLFKRHINYAGEVTTVIPNGKAVIKDNLLFFEPFDNQ